MNAFATGILGGIVFTCGLLFGRWQSEVAARKTRESMERDRIMVSMPADRKHAARVMELLAALLHQAQAEADSTVTEGPSNDR